MTNELSHNSFVRWLLAVPLNAIVLAYMNTFMKALRSAPNAALFLLVASCSTATSVDGGRDMDVPNTPAVDVVGASDNQPVPVDSQPTSGDVQLPAGDTTPRAVAAAEAFLAMLTEPQRTAATYPYDDAAQRIRWSNFPTGIFARTGARWGDLNAAQQAAVLNLLSVILSPAGYLQVRQTVAADEALRVSSGGGRLMFGAAEYYVAIRGTPSVTQPWCVQFGGHHLAINATIVGSNITLAPSLTGAQPASFAFEGVTTRPQGAELDAAFAMVNALDATQRTRAIIGQTFIDLVLGPGQDGRMVAPEGLPASAMTPAQRAMLLTLIRTRVGMLNDEDASLQMAAIEAQLDTTYFAWAGATAAGSPAYFRITGPRLFMEYSPQAMGGNGTDHTHAMYRDFTNEYGVAFPR